MFSYANVLGNKLGNTEKKTSLGWKNILLVRSNQSGNRYRVSCVEGSDPKHYATELHIANSEQVKWHSAETYLLSACGYLIKWPYIKANMAYGKKFAPLHHKNICSSSDDAYGNMLLIRCNFFILHEIKPWNLGFFFLFLNEQNIYTI